MPSTSNQKLDNDDEDSELRRAVDGEAFALSGDVVFSHVKKQKVWYATKAPEAWRRRDEAAVEGYGFIDRVVAPSDDLAWLQNRIMSPGVVPATIAPMLDLRRTKSGVFVSLRPVPEPGASDGDEVKRGAALAERRIPPVDSARCGGNHDATSRHFLWSVALDEQNGPTL